MSEMMGIDRNYLETGLCHVGDAGFGEAFTDGRYIEVSTWADENGLRLSVFNGGRSICVDSRPMDTEPPADIPGRLDCESYCSMLNHGQSFFSATVTDRGIVISSVLDNANLVRAKDVSDLLGWVGCAVSAIAINCLDLDRKVGEPDRLESVAATHDQFLRAIKTYMPHLSGTDYPHAPGAPRG
jgi:hypothetical protein